MLIAAAIFFVVGVVLMVIGLPGDVSDYPRERGAAIMFGVACLGIALLLLLVAAFS